MEELRSGTAKARALRDAYDAAGMTTLREAYPSGYSLAKENAYDYCRGLCGQLNGYGFAITSKNTFKFCAAFLYDDATTGATMLVYITPGHDYVTRYDA